MRRTVVILLFDEVEVLDFAGPFEVFAAADELADGTLFDVRTVAARAGEVGARGGLRVGARHGLADCPGADVLVVPGGFGTRALLADTVMIDWIQRSAARAEATLGVCTGSLLLARAGLLSGLRVTTHHELLGMLSQLAPAAVVDASARFHDNGRITTAAGISAGIDAALHLVGRLAGEDAAARTARYMEYERRG